MISPEQNSIKLDMLSSKISVLPDTIIDREQFVKL